MSLLIQWLEGMHIDVEVSGKCLRKSNSTQPVPSVKMHVKLVLFLLLGKQLKLTNNNVTHVEIVSSHVR